MGIQTLYLVSLNGSYNNDKADGIGNQLVT